MRPQTNVCLVEWGATVWRWHKVKEGAVSSNILEKHDIEDVLERMHNRLQIDPSILAHCGQP